MHRIEGRKERSQLLPPEGLCSLRCVVARLRDGVLRVMVVACALRASYAWDCLLFDVDLACCVTWTELSPQDFGGVITGVATMGVRALQLLQSHRARATSESQRVSTRGGALAGANARQSDKAQPPANGTRASTASRSTRQLQPKQPKKPKKGARAGM